MKQSLWIYFVIGVSVTKSWEKSRIFSSMLPLDFLRKGQKQAVGGRTAPPPQKKIDNRVRKKSEKGKHRY